MPIDTKQLTTSEVFDRLNAIGEFSEEHPEEWRNEVARDLNHLVGYAIRWFVSDRKSAAVILSIVERVAEFENIKSKGKPHG